MQKTVNFIAIPSVLGVYSSTILGIDSDLFHEAQISSNAKHLLSNGTSNISSCI